LEPGVALGFETLASVQLLERHAIKAIGFDF
jgi:hypothetical protein